MILASLFMQSILAQAIVKTFTINVIPHSSWGDSPLIDKCKKHQINNISIHHSATFTLNNNKVPNHLLSYQKYHMKNGWMDIAYHFIIDLEGNIYQGRPLNCAGDTFTSYDPSGHLLIMIDGNYEEQEISNKSWKSTEMMINWAFQEYDLSKKNLHSHKELANTLCPGQYIIDKMDQGITITTNANYDLKLMNDNSDP